MAKQEVHLELLLGKRLRDRSGTTVGRIEEVRAEQRGEECVVYEYLVGQAALLERLSAWTIGWGILHLFGARKSNGSFRVPWDKLDLTDVEQPRLCCTLQELQVLDDQPEREDASRGRD